MKLLPNQFGTYLAEKGISYPNLEQGEDSNREVYSYLDLLNIDKPNLDEFISLFNEKTPTLFRTAFVIRNNLLDIVKFYYRVYSEAPNFNDIKEVYTLKGEQAYRFLKSFKFRKYLRSIDSKYDVKPPLSLSIEVLDMLNNTYTQANLLNKKAVN